MPSIPLQPPPELRFQADGNTTTTPSHQQHHSDAQHQRMSDFPLPVGPRSLNRISIVQPSMEMKNKEAMLFNALIATCKPPAKPTINDIYTTIQDHIGLQHAPTTIMAYPPDFILQFSNPDSRNIVYTCKTLKGHGFTLDLQPWTPNHRSLVIIPWNTKVTINIKGIPPHAFYPDTLNPLLASYCDIQTYHFNQEDGTCTINAFVSSIE
uniref:Uncharacterized protein n=1 Tax=Arundo donax TaxID=35708 RepID=A0A0A8Y0G7_ARUDO